MKKLVSFLFASTAVLHSLAQDNHYTLVPFVPMTINPALTGQFDGRLRAAAGYRNQYSTAVLPFNSYYFSADAPVLNVNNYAYLAVGALVNGGMSGDGTLGSFAGDVSAAYHIAPLSEVDNKLVAENDLALGVQGGYRQASVDLSRLYFANTSTTSFIPGGSPFYQLGLGNTYSRYVVNAGFTFTHRNQRLTYTAGMGIDNLNQPSDAVLRQTSSALGMDKRINVLASADIHLDQYFSLRPNAYFLSAPAFNVFFGGTDLALRLPVKDTSVTFSLGVWYRSGSIGSVTAGVQYYRFGFSLAYDYSMGGVTGSQARGALEFGLRYILPSSPDPDFHPQKKRTQPSPRP